MFPRGDNRPPTLRSDFDASGTAMAPEPAARGLVPGNGVLFTYYRENELVITATVSARRQRIGDPDPLAAVLQANPGLRRFSV